MDQPLTSEVKASRVIITAFLVDCLDVLLGVIVAALSGSIVMLSQVLEGLADVISSGFLIIGYKKSQKNPDKTHPFGYGREIYFWTLISALVMFGISATFSFYLGWQRFIHPEPVEDIFLALTILAITVVTNGYACFLSLKRLLRKRPITHIIQIFFRSSLVETKTTFILDLMGLLASLLGIIALVGYRMTGDYRLDGVGAMTIGIVLAFFSYLLIMGIRDLLVGRSASAEVEQRIRDAAKKIEAVKDIHRLRTMHIGSERLLVDMDIHFSARLTTREIEKVIDDIKEQIRKEVPTVKQIQIELESER